MTTVIISKTLCNSVSIAESFENALENLADNDPGFNGFRYSVQIGTVDYGSFLVETDLDELLARRLNSVLSDALR